MALVDIGEILGGGFNTWKNNLSISVPFILNYVISFCIAIAILFAVLTSISNLGIYSMAAVSATSNNMFSQLASALLENILIIIIAFIAIAIIVGIINAFFTAGAIGMAKEAIMTGTTNLSHMFDYGKRKFLSLLGASILVSLILAVGLLFIIPGLLIFYSSVSGSLNTLSSPSSWSMLSSTSSLEFLSSLLWLLLGLLLMGIYMIVMSIFLALVQYAVVVDDLRAIEGFKRGIRVFLNNKLSVFLIWLIVLVFSIMFAVIQSAMSIIPFVGVFIYFALMALIYYPLMTIWYTKLYLTIPKT